MNNAKPEITEDTLVPGKSYTMVSKPNRFHATTVKTYLGRYAGIIKEDPLYTRTDTGQHEIRGVITKTNVHSFPNREQGTGVAPTKFPVGHFNTFGTTFEEGDTTKQQGGRRRKTRARKTRHRNRRSLRSRHRSRRSLRSRR